MSEIQFGRPEEQVEVPDSGDALKKFKEELKAEMLQVVNEASAKQFQAIQSMTAKQDAAVKKEFEQRLEALKNAGLTPTPEQAAKIQDDTRKQLTKEADTVEQVNEKPTSGTLKPTSPENLHPVVAIAYDMAARAGVKIDESSESAKLIDTETKDEVKFLASVQDYINAELAIAQKANEKPFNPALSPGFVGSGKSGGKNLEADYREALGKAQGDVNRIIELKKEYRSKGLKI